MYILTLLIPYIFNSSKDYSEKETANFDFYTADYDENIFEDEEYLSLIENGIIKYDNASGLMVDITFENAKDQGETIDFLAKYIESIINGDNESYNSFFSTKYYKNNSPKDRYTMQKVYDATITYYTVSDEEEKTANYTKYVYKLKYRIYKNNGTFRQDIGDDSKTQYIVITNREGKWLIDSVNSPQYK